MPSYNYPNTSPNDDSIHLADNIVQLDKSASPAIDNADKALDSELNNMDLKEPQRDGTVLSGFSVITKSMIGSGIFGMARACSKFGIVAAVVCLLLAASITWLSLRVLSILALDYRLENPTFYSVSEKLLPRLRWVLDVALIINCLGASIVYVQTAGNLMAYAIMALFGIDQNVLDQSHIAMIVQSIMVLSLAPLCMMRTISATQIPNLLGLSCLLYIVIMTFFYTPMGGVYPLYPGNGAMVALGSFPTFIFAFACQQNMFPVANELKNANLTRLNTVAASSTITGFIVYLPMMIIPVLSFGMSIESNYLFNMVNADGTIDTPVLVAFVLASISVSISYVLQVHPVRRSIISLVYGSEQLVGKKEKTVRVAVVSLILVISFALAVGLGKNLNIPINIAGLLGGNTMCFVMPFGLYLAKYGMLTNALSKLIFGLLVFCIALYPICMTGIISDAIATI